MQTRDGLPEMESAVYVANHVMRGDGVAVMSECLAGD